MGFDGRILRSRVERAGVLKLWLEDVTVDQPGPGEIVVRVEASPINPSDIGLLLGAADIATLEASGAPDRPVAAFALSPARLSAMQGRFEQPLAVGNEGAGTVVAAGEGAGHLMGRRVGMVGGAMYADYRKIPARDVLLLPMGRAPPMARRCSSIR